MLCSQAARQCKSALVATPGEVNELFNGVFLTQVFVLQIPADPHPLWVGYYSAYSSVAAIELKLRIYSFHPLAIMGINHSDN